MAWSWIKDDDRRLVIVNLSDQPAQARVKIPWDELRGSSWRLTDTLSETTYERDGNDMTNSGLYVELEPWGHCAFQYRRT